MQTEYTRLFDSMFTICLDLIYAYLSPNEDLKPA